MLSYSYYGADRRNYIVFGLAYVRRSPGGKPEIVFRWDRIFLVISLLTVIAWLSASLALYLFFQHKRNYKEVSFAKMLILPIRYADHQREMGEYYIKEGNKAWEEQEYRTAIGLLRAGLPKVPDDLETRKKIAQVYFFRPTTAISILEDGLNYNPDREYLIFLFNAYKQFRYDLEAIDTANMLLERGDLSEDEELVVNAFKANSLYVRGKYSEAVEVIEDANLNSIGDGLILTAQMTWGRGDKDKAIKMLQDTILRIPSFTEAYTLLDQYLRNENRFDEAMRYAILQNTNAPLEYQSRISILYNFTSQKKGEEVKKEIEAFFKDFPRNSEALLALANFGANIGNSEVTKRVFDLFEKQNNPSIAFIALAHTQALNGAGQYEEALAFAENVATRLELTDYQKAMFHSLLAISYLKSNETDVGNYNLTQFLESPEPRAEDRLNTAKLLFSNGFTSHAIDVLETAYRSAPDNQNILNLLVRAKVNIADVENLNSYLDTIFTTMRRPDYDLLKDTLDLLSSDRYLFSYKRDEILNTIQKLISGQSIDS